VIRFESAHRLLAASPRSRIADIAARCGYYDQAHLDRDWRALTGLSPTAWLSHELPFVQDGTADER
jgi:AraC-like DNA-binding protein